jgi:hypothetical protein
LSAKVDTVTLDGLARLLEQFKDSGNLRALIASYLDQIQALEDAAYPIFAQRNLTNAVGHRLDGIGQIFNVFRGGRSDADYRLAIQGEIAVLLSNGTGDDILNIVQLFVQMGTPAYYFLEMFPKTVYLRAINHALTVDPALVTNMLKRAVSAATKMLYVYSLYDDSATFSMSSLATSSETSSTLGMADDAQTTGGHFANSL